MTLPPVLSRIFGVLSAAARVLRPTQNGNAPLEGPNQLRTTPLECQTHGHRMSKQAKIFIDGAAGTTGLEIRERLAGRHELSLIALSEAERKDQAARKRALNDADL